MMIDGAEVQIGIASFGDSSCAQVGVSTRVDAYVSFIEREAGIEPSNPGDPVDPIDPDGDEPSDDDGGGCAAGGSDAGALAILAVLGIVASRRRAR